MVSLEKLLCEFLLLSFIILSVEGFSQHGSGRKSGRNDRKLIANDSVHHGLQKQTDSVAHILPERTPPEKAEEAKQAEEQNRKNIDYILQLQKENRSGQKRNALIRIGIGVVLFFILILGLRRKRKKVK